MGAGEGGEGGKEEQQQSAEKKKRAEDILHTLAPYLLILHPECAHLNPKCSVN